MRCCRAALANRHRLHLFPLLLLGLLLGTTQTAAQIVIQGFDSTRDGGPSPFHTLGFTTSPYYTAVREALVNEYGAGVVFGTPAAPGGVPEVTADVLREVDIFVVTGMSLALSPQESCLLNAFVENGGAVLSFRNEWTLPTLLGTQPVDFGGSGFAAIVDAASPIIAGPFGTVDTPVRAGANSSYDPGTGWPVLTDLGRNILVIFGAETGHMGRAVVIGDEEIFLNGPTPFGGDFHGVRANNQMLFKNVIDYLAGAPGLVENAFTGLDVCLDADGDGVNALDDCDDTVCIVHPGAPELLDGTDNDCDGQVDEGLDSDGDGVPDFMDACAGTVAGGGVDAQGCAVVCSDPGPTVVDNDGDGYAEGEDCDDAAADIHPQAMEIPGNAVDENCDAQATCHPDAGWRNHGSYVACVAREVSLLVASRQLTVAAGRQLIREAAQGDTGRLGRDLRAVSRRR